MIGGIFIPMALIIIFDLVIFVMVMRKLYLSQNMPGKHVNTSKHEQRMQRLKSALTVIVLLGLTWIFGYLTTIQTPAGDSVEFALDIVFIILNSLQGVFLFVLYGLWNAKARASWGLLWERCFPTTKKKVSSSKDDQRSPRTKTQSLSSSDHKSKGKKYRRKKTREPTSETSQETITVIVKPRTNGGHENSGFVESDGGDGTVQGLYFEIPRVKLRVNHK